MSLRSMLALVPALLLPAPAAADPTNASEMSRHFGSVRNWQVDALHRDGLHTGCRATIPLQAAGPLLVERRPGAGWTLYLPGPQTTDTAPGTLAIDDADEAMEFRPLGHGWAAQALDDAHLQRLRDGNYLRVTFADEEMREWILNGSTAALDMVADCDDRQGL